MPKYTAHEHEAVRATLRAADVTASVSGVTVDTAGTHGECLVVANYGTGSGTGSSTIKMQDNTADVATGWTDITGATFAAVTTANDDTIFTGRLDLKKRKQFVRAVETIAGSFKSKRSVELIMRASHKRPASQTNANVFSV